MLLLLLLLMITVTYSISFDRSYILRKLIYYFSITELHQLIDLLRSVKGITKVEKETARYVEYEFIVPG